MTERFRVGDRVRPTAGGPIMRVREIRGRVVVCSWYEPREGWREKTFAEAALKRVGRSRAPAAGTE
jgi:uncharacterized protein YodC (DUF2158 family)